MTPKQAQRQMDAYLAELEKAKRLTLKVGVTKGEAGRRVYESGDSVVEVAATHEYGTPRVPRRSFLRMPFDVKQGDLNARTDAEFRKVFDGASTASDGLERLGVEAVNISQQAFRTNGFGNWPSLAESTMEYKAEVGKRNPLIMTGTLRQSITWEVE